MKILLDNGHGVNTPGKRSPDGRLLEYKYAREIAQDVYKELRGRGYDADILTPEETDTPLSTRTQRANTISRANKGQAVVISIHCNAAGADGKWHDARGWSAHVSLNASNKSKRLAECLAKAAEAVGLRVRKPEPRTAYWPQNLAICRDTVCPAVLTENLFQDQEQDVAYLLSDAGRKAIISLHVEGIVAYIKGV